MEEKNDLNAFLKKIDDVGSIIKDLNVGADGEEREKAMRRADEFLESNDCGQNDGFNRTVINKNDGGDADYNEQNNTNRTETSQDEFMKYVEQDSKERTVRRIENIKSSLVWKEKGNVSFKAGQYSDAVEYYTNAIKMAPDQLVYYSNRAQAYIKLGKNELAVKDCETGLRLDEKNVKLHINKGRALTNLNKFDEATYVFNDVLNIDKKQHKLISGYMVEMNKRRSEYTKESEVNDLLQQGDKRIFEMKIIIDKLSKGLVLDTIEIDRSLCELKQLVEQNNYQTAFRQCKGFKIFSQNQAVNKMLKKNQRDCVESHEISLISLLSSVVVDNEENCCIVCKMESALRLCVHLVEKGTTLQARFEGVQFFYTLSQVDDCRSSLIQNTPIKRLLDKVLMLLGDGGDLSLVAIGMINNLALDKRFVTDHEQQLCTDFIPGIVKMMDVLCLPISADERITKNFLPVMSTSISTIANLFRNDAVRKQFLDHDIWKSSVNLVGKYCDTKKDLNRKKIVTSTLAMLMNLSIDQVVVPTESYEPMIQSSRIVFSNKTICEIQERYCGVWSRVLAHNEDLLKKVVEHDLHEYFIGILENGNENTQKHVIKCLALLTRCSEKVCYILHNKKGAHRLLAILSTSTDAIQIGNTALCFSHLAKYKNIAISLADSQLIKRLLMHATNDGLPGNVRHNCATAIGKFALIDNRFLQQLRDLHGMEILHEVMKENKMV